MTRSFQHVVIQVFETIWEGFAKNISPVKSNLKSSFTWIIFQFYAGLQNSFVVQYLDLHKIGEAEVWISSRKQPPKVNLEKLIGFSKSLDLLSSFLRKLIGFPKVWMIGYFEWHITNSPLM